MSEKVLVTGGFGLVGSQTVRRLVADGHRVVATDLGTAAQRKAARMLPADAEAHWADLTDRGLVDVLPGGRPGDPDSDENWFVTDWMDTTRAQQVLRFQHHPWPDMLVEMRAAAGWRRYPMRLIAQLARQFLKSRAAYRDTPGRYADPWGAIRAALGDPSPDAPGRTGST